MLCKGVSCQPPTIWAGLAWWAQRKPLCDHRRGLSTILGREKRSCMPGSTARKDLIETRFLLTVTWPTPALWQVMFLRKEHGAGMWPQEEGHILRVDDGGTVSIPTSLCLDLHTPCFLDELEGRTSSLWDQTRPGTKGQQTCGHPRDTREARWWGLGPMWRGKGSHADPKPSSRAGLLQGAWWPRLAEGFNHSWFLL